MYTFKEYKMVELDQKDVNRYLVTKYRMIKKE